MKTSETYYHPVVPQATANLLEAIRGVLANIGDGLNDTELTGLLQKTALPTHGEFRFVSYADRSVTLSVPTQNLANWYPKEGWILPAKREVALAIAEQHDLSLCEPPDTLYPWMDLPNPHHHLELSNGREIVIVAHPYYLKVKLFVAGDPVRHSRNSQKPLTLGADILEDLAALY
jgi:hypothetical protein